MPCGRLEEECIPHQGFGVDQSTVPYTDHRVLEESFCRLHCMLCMSTTLGVVGAAG